jgi:hypothetical protein
MRKISTLRLRHKNIGGHKSRALASSPHRSTFGEREGQLLVRNERYPKWKLRLGQPLIIFHGLAVHDLKELDSTLQLKALLA